MMRVSTFAVLQHGLHRTLPVRVPADTSRAGALALLRPPALPQIDLVEVIHQEQSCGRHRHLSLLPRHVLPDEVRAGHVLVRGSPGWAALYSSSCRKGSELTRSGALDGWKNSAATNSPDVLLSWKSRGVKLNLPGSERKNRIQHETIYFEYSPH